MDGTSMLTTRHYMVTSWVHWGIFTLQGTTLRWFWKHKGVSWRLLVQEKYNCFMQKVDWKSGISDELFECSDFVSLWMIVPCWLLHIMWWLCRHPKDDKYFYDCPYHSILTEMFHNIIFVCIKWVAVAQNCFKATLKKHPDCNIILKSRLWLSQS